MELELELTQQGSSYEVSVAVCSSLRSPKSKRTTESRAKRSSKIISLGHYFNLLASSYTVTMKIEILLEPTSNKLLVANELTDAFGKPFEVLNNVFEHVDCVYCFKTKVFPIKLISRSKLSMCHKSFKSDTRLIFKSISHQSVGFNSLVHSLRALSALRRSGLRMASTAAKPCQVDSLKFYLITDSIYTDQQGTVVLATLFNGSEQRHFRSFITNINLQEHRRLQLLAKRISIHNFMLTLQTHYRRQQKDLQHSFCNSDVCCYDSRYGEHAGPNFTTSQNGNVPQQG
nr:hypothetical protein [Tanacetum cinerariifolium]